MEHLIATWIVAVWQRRRLGEYAPGWDPDGAHSPNSLFAASFAQAGFAMQIPSPELFYELLPAHYVSRISRRGVKIRGLWYDGPALNDYRGTASSRGGRHKGQWVIRRDPRDRRGVFFQDPVTHAWHELPWTGMPPGGQAPAFGDARVRDLLRKADACGLKPRSDTELLPVLLELIGARIPVSRWPTQMAKAERTEHAREVAQAQAAQADRPRAAAWPGNRDTRRRARRSQRYPAAPRARLAPAGQAGPRRHRCRAPPPAGGGRPGHPEAAAPPGSKLPGPQRVRAARGRRGGPASVTDQPATGENPVVPFLRAGPPPDRTRWEGWQQWRTTRGCFIPAPRLSLAEYQALSPRGRALHDLHRTATHVNLRLQETPMSRKVSDLMRGRLQNNAVKFVPGHPRRADDQRRRVPGQDRDRLLGRGRVRGPVARHLPPARARPRPGDPGPVRAGGLLPAPGPGDPQGPVQDHPGRLRRPAPRHPARPGPVGPRRGPRPRHDRAAHRRHHQAPAAPRR